MSETSGQRALRRALWHAVEKRNSRRAWLWLRDVLNALLDGSEPPEIPKVSEKLPEHPDET